MGNRVHKEAGLAWPDLCTIVGNDTRSEHILSTLGGFSKSARADVTPFIAKHFP
jgi:hypothetical protein